MHPSSFGPVERPSPCEWRSICARRVGVWLGAAEMLRSGGDVARRWVVEWVRDGRMRRRQPGNGRWRKKKDEFFVPTPESTRFLDTVTTPMVLTALGLVLFSKLLMMDHNSTAQERLERKIQKAPAGQGTIRMLTREEWDEIQDIRPRTPFESALARPNARIRTGDPKKLEDLKNWTIDVFADALTRVEETVKRK